MRNKTVNTKIDFPMDAVRQFCQRWKIRELLLFGSVLRADFHASSDVDLLVHFAVISQIQIIGEAAKRLSNSFRDSHPSIPWQQIAGMRDVLFHSYDRVDLKRVWSVATTAVPDLTKCIKPLLPAEQ